MTRRHTATAALALLISSSSSLALAQTPLGGQNGQVPTRTIGQSVPTTPPGKAPASAPPAQTPPQQQQQPTQGQQTQAAAPRVPMSVSSYNQALDQSEGSYPEMQRSGSGGQIQEAWNEAQEDRQGVYTPKLCVNCVYKVRAREFMTTTLILPEDAVITSADLGDPVGFKAQVKTANKVAVRPNGYGFDTNLNVYTKSGAVYPFYIQAHSYNSKFVPDLKVEIIGREKPQEIETLAVAAPEPPKSAATAVHTSAADPKSAAIRDLTTPSPAKGDFIRNVPFDPAKLHGWKDYELKGDRELKPEVVYRDDFFTYIRYGAKWDPLELPTGYVTIDGIDELVNTRVQGSTLIIESVNPLITLKSGKRYLCIRYTGEQP